MGGYLAYTEYKDSGIGWLGEIPKHWDVIALHYACEFLNRKRVPLSSEERGLMSEKFYPYYGASGIIDYVENFIFEESTVLIAEDGANLLSRSTPLAFIAKGQYWVNNHAHILKPLQGPFEYWANLLCTIEYDPWITGAAQPKLTKENLGSIKLPFPPVEEQQSIARFLDYKTAQIDALIAKKEALLKKLAEKRTALISQAVTKGLDPTVPMKDSGIEWLGEIPAHWEVMQMRRRWKVIDCKHKTVEFIDEGFPIASIGEVRDHKFNLAQAKRASLNDYLDLIEGRKPERNDLIYSRNATVGCVGFIDQDTDFCMGQDVCLIKAGAENNRFLWWQLQSKSVLDQLQAIFVGATFKRINVADIKAYLICCPPPDEQEAIAQYLDKETRLIDQQRVKIEEAIDKLKEYRTALITNAVTGKIDVRDIKLPVTDSMEAA